MSMTMRDVKVYESLTVVHLDGFEPKEEEPGVVDLPGSANWLCESGYGMAADRSDADTDHPGILQADYDSSPDEPWKFSVLIDSEEVEALTTFATEAGYTVLKSEAVSEPDVYGDGGGTVEILKHRDGWVILEN